MLKIIRSYLKIDTVQLKSVYEESCRKQGNVVYGHHHPTQQIFLAEQEMVEGVKCFFRDRDAFYAVWILNERYVSALRMEPYRDGYLLEGLETHPDMRKRGYATRLVHEVCDQISVPVYSHVDKNNAPSLAVHRACGFQIIKDFAVYIDGSVSHQAYTLRK